MNRAKSSAKKNRPIMIHLFYNSISE